MPAPEVSKAAAERILVEHYGLHARASALGSQQDKNFLISGSDGEILGVLKVANPAFSESEIEAQELATELIASAEPSLRIAVAHPNTDGAPCTRVAGLLDGAAAFVRLLRFLPGGTLVESNLLSRSVIAELGVVAGRVSRALVEFEHPGLDRIVQWDLKYGAVVVAKLIEHVADPAARARLTRTADGAWVRVEPHIDELPEQAVHLDLTDANVVATAGDDGRRHPDGVIDFGDLTRSWAVSELAITVSSVLHHADSGPASILPAVRAFHRLRPLGMAEVEVLWPLAVLRSAVLIVSSAQQAALDADNAYVADQMDDEWRMFERATSVPIDVMTALIKADLGFDLPVDELTSPAALVPMLDPASTITLDLSPESDAMDDGAWLEPDVEDVLARQAVGAGAACVVTRFGEPRLSAAPPLSQVSPDVVATGIGLWFAAPTKLAAPWDGEITEDADDGVVVRGDHYEMTLLGVDEAPIGSRLTAGAVMLEAPPGRWISVSVRPVGAPVAPRLVRPELAAGWLAMCRDPRPLLRLPPVITQRSDRGLLARRDHTFARVQEHYYDAPPQIERGWRHTLVSLDGRCYLDMVNNVTALGHSHPRVAEAAARQLRKLNTNSRFNYHVVVDFCERLAATLPDQLSTVFLVNSGSEANDLALRLAMAATGRHDVVAIREAYHGWTYATDAVSTSVADNPNALMTRPPWVHTVDSPNSFRGKYRGADAELYAAEAVRVIAALAADGRAPAAFISETVYGSAGGMALPDGYLADVYGAMRACGGLCIADEVQVGYGRLGHWFWGFEQQGVLPDIVVTAKAAGNGYPLGAVVTSSETADRYRTEGYFFSSTGGSPLACAVGVTVLDVLRDEQLPQNAARVGGRLKARLQSLQHNHPIIGTVHGFGLYLGVELVRDRVTLQPATEETRAICERMLDLGVIIQPTGDHMNILKTKPPLGLDIDSADFYVDTLDRVLTEGW